MLCVQQSSSAINAVRPTLELPVMLLQLLPIPRDDSKSNFDRLWLQPLAMS